LLFPRCVAAELGAVSSAQAMSAEWRTAWLTNHEWSRTTALTARSTYVKTLVSRPVILTRKKAVLALAIAAALTTFGLLEAQQPAPVAGAGVNPAGANASKYNIAVVDISYIFKKHDRFKSTMEQMKKEMEAIETELKGDREKIAAQEQQRNQFNAGSAEYKKMDEDIARQMADFNLKMGKLRKEFLEREAKVYYSTYLEVVDAVKYYAKRQGIGLVLRFNGEAVDPNRRDDVLREINKPVVVQDQIDITPDVIMLLNRDQSSGQPVAPAGTQTTRPVQIPR
jgi:Skp family chaperone for outer membrane proteins